MIFKKKKVTTIFDKTNAEVMEALKSMLNDIRAIITDEEYPNIFIAPDKLNENASKVELGQAYISEKVGERMYELLRVFLTKKPQNVFNILDILFCAEKGTYANKTFKETMDDLTYIGKEDLKYIINFMRATDLLK